MKENDVCLIIADKSLHKKEKHGVKLGSIVVIDDVDKNEEYPIFASYDIFDAMVFRKEELLKIGKL
jgi:hypothetical protein